MTERRCLDERRDAHEARRLPLAEWDRRGLPEFPRGGRPEIIELDGLMMLVPQGQRVRAD